MKAVLVLPVIALLLILACGCTGAPPAQPAAPAPAAVTTTPSPVKTPVATPVIIISQTTSVSENTIIIAKNTFRPANMTVKVGSTVRWYNTDDHPHRIEFMNKAFSASTYLLGSSQSASQRFDRPGRYDFACMIHPEMQGSILVEE